MAIVRRLYRGGKRVACVRVRANTRRSHPIAVELPTVSCPPATNQVGARCCHMCSYAVSASRTKRGPSPSGVWRKKSCIFSTEQTFRAARRPSLYRHGHARFKRTGSGHGELQRPIRAGCTRCTSRPILVWWYGVVSCIIMPRLPRCIYAEATHSSYVLRTKLHDRDRGHEGLSIYQRNAAWTLAKVLR